MSGLKFNVIKKGFDYKNKTNMENYLLNKGIENTEMFLYPEKYKDEIETNSDDLYGIDKAVKIFENALHKQLKIGILVDDDADGYTSTSALIKIIKLNSFNLDNLQLFINNNKSHGLYSGVYNDILTSDCDLIIIPDSASNDFDRHIELLENGKQLVILDHHGIDNVERVIDLMSEYDQYALVNNQIENGKENNVHLTGAGVVYKFAQSLDKKNNTNYANEIVDLVAVGQIADASDISNYEIRLFIKEGLNEIKSPLLKQCFIDKIKDEETIAPINLSFSIIPMINAISRIGSVEEKEKLIKGLYGHWDESETIKVKRRRKNPITKKMEPVELDWTHYELLLDELKKKKSAQDRIVNKTKEAMNDFLTISNIAIVIIPEDMIEYRSTTGLIANKIATEQMMPTLVLVEKEDSSVLNGSARGYSDTLEDFRGWCLSTDLFNLAQGHDNAFGVEIKTVNIEKLIKASEDTITEREKNYNVDGLFYNKVNLKQVKEINDLRHLFGGSVSFPVYGYKDLVLTRNSISQRGSVLTFFYQGLEFIAYKQQVDLLDNLLAEAGFNQYFKVDLVGEPTLNEWMGRKKHQIVLQDFHIEVIEDQPTPKEETPEKWLDNGKLSF